METIKIEVFSDVVCPWCYIGKKRLEQALQSLKGQFEFEISFLAYELDPTLSEEGSSDWRQKMAEKFGSEERLKQLSEEVRKQGESEGIDFAFDKISRSYSTFPLHKILHAGGTSRNNLTDAFFKAYFTDGKDLSDRKVLAEITSPFGISAAELEKILADDSNAYAVRKEEAFAREIGVRGVPFFIIADKYGFSGAQPAETIRQTILSVSEKENIPAHNAPTCDAEVCE